MTSEYLQGEHEEIYAHFFEKHDLVIGLPYTFRWWPSVARGKKQIIIKQKLPTKMFCGVSLTPQKWVSIKTISCFEHVNNIFEEKQANHTFTSDNLGMIEKSVAYYLDYYEYIGGVEISFLSEHNRWYGFGFMGVMCTLLASMIFLITDKISPEILEDYDEFMHSNIFKKIYVLALQIDQDAQWTPSGLSPYVTLHNSSVPMVQMWPIHTSITKRFDGELQYDTNIDNIRSLEEIIIDRIVWFQDLPIDYALLSFGVAYDAKTIRRKYQNFDSLFSQTIWFIHTLSSQLPYASYLVDHLRWDIADMSSFLYARILQSWSDMMVYAGEEHYINRFIESINDSGAYDIFIDKEHHNITNLYYWFDHEKTFSHEKIWVVPISTAKQWWTFLLVCFKNKSRKTLRSLLEKLHDQWYTWAVYEHLSWRDGITHDGLRIYQYLSQGIYSRHIKPWSVVFLGGDGIRYIANHDDILGKEDQGIVLDKVYGKIYVKGKKLTHKDLRSQSGTVEIISLLFDRSGDYIHNSELPISSYSKNKNEMLGKIILPFKALVKEHFDTDIGLECTWSIYDFQVKWWTGMYDFLFSVVQEL